MTTLNEYQDWALRTDRGNKTDKDEMMICCAMGLAGESGEYVDLIKKVAFHGKALDKEKAAKELGDILWYLSVASYYLGYDLEHIATLNKAKLEARYPSGFSIEDAQRRRDENP